MGGTVGQMVENGKISKNNYIVSFHAYHLLNKSMSYHCLCNNGTARVSLVPLIVCRWQHIQGKQIKFPTHQNQNKVRQNEYFFTK
jgi:hypothetical protein